MSLCPGNFLVAPLVRALSRQLSDLNPVNVGRLIRSGRTDVLKMTGVERSEGQQVETFGVCYRCTG